jgi:lysophospholipase L1-like esterase
MQTVVLIGDSIRKSYEQTVRKLLADVAEVVSPENGGPSSQVLRDFRENVVAQRPDLVHINAGLHDLKKIGDPPAHQVPPDQYRQNLRTIVHRIRDETKATIIWALTTPIDKRKSVKLRSETDVTLYNRIAREVMEEAQVPMNDLYQFVMDGGRDQMISEDGIHFTPEGASALGKRVAEVIREALT